MFGFVALTRSCCVQVTVDVNLDFPELNPEYHRFIVVDHAAHKGKRITTKALLATVDCPSFYDYIQGNVEMYCCPKEPHNLFTKICSAPRSYTETTSNEYYLWVKKVYRLKDPDICRAEQTARTAFISDPSRHTKFIRWRFEPSDFKFDNLVFSPASDTGLVAKTPCPIAHESQDHVAVGTAAAVDPSLFIKNAKLWMREYTQFMLVTKQSYADDALRLRFLVAIEGTAESLDTLPVSNTPTKEIDRMNAKATKSGTKKNKKSSKKKKKDPFAFSGFYD